MGVGQAIRDFILAEPRQQRVMVHTRAAGNSIIPWTANKPAWLPNAIDSYDHEAFRKVALIHRCVEYIANAAGSAPMRVMVQSGTGAPEEDTQHPLRHLVVRPNVGMGEARFTSFVAMAMAVTGFALIEKERDRLGNVIGLWPLRSDWARPIPRQNDAPDWEYRIPGRQEAIILESEDVIAIPWADTPDLSPVGIGPMAVILREVGIMNAMTDFLKAFMDRGAMPLYVMMTNDDPRVATQWNDPVRTERFREAFRQRYGGISRALDPMPLIGIKDIKPLGFNFNELAYPELNKLADARICTGFGVPPILLGTQVGLERSTFNNTAEARRSFYEDTMTYLWARIDDAFTRGLLWEFEQRPGYSIEFDTSDIPALQDDVNDAWQRATPALQAGGITLNMFLREVGQEPIGDGGDVFYIPFSATVTPVGEMGKPKPAPKAIAPVAVGDDDADDPDDEDPDPDDARFVIRDGRRYSNERALSALGRDRRDAMASGNRLRIEQLATLLAPHVDRYLDEQRDRVVTAAVGAARSHDAALPSTGERRALALSLSHRSVEAIDWATEEDLLRAIFRAWMDTVGPIAFEAASGATGVGVSWNLSNPFLIDVFDSLGKRVTLITDETRVNIEHIVRENLLAGTTIDDLGDALRGLFDETYANRHIAIARTESMHAYGEASVAAYRASGVVSDVQLLDNPAHDARYGASDGLSCAERHTMIVPLGQVSRHLSAEHPNGTLSIAPVLRDPLPGEVGE